MSNINHDRMPRKLFLSWTSFSSAQKLCLLILFILYNYFRIKMRLAQPFMGDEMYELEIAYQQSNPLRMMLWARGDIVRLPFGHEFWLSFYPLLISKNNPMLIPLVTLPHFLGTNLFFYLFAKTNWPFLLGFQKSSFSKQNLLWLNIFSLLQVTFNQTLIFHALESRSYSFLPLFALFFLYLSWYAWKSPVFRWRYLIFAIFVINYNVYGAIMFSAALFYVILICLWEEWQESRRFNLPDLRSALLKVLKLYGVTIGILLIILSFFPKHFRYDRNVHQFIGPGWSMIRQVFSLLFYCPLIRNFSIPLLVLGTLYLIRKRWQPIGFALIFVCLPIVVTYGLDLVSGYWFLQRQFVWVLPFWAVFVSACYLAAWEWISEVKKCQKAAAKI